MDWNSELLRKATQGFSDSHRIGEGGFGPVYWGMMWGTKVAIKVLRLKNETDFNERMAQDQYHTEVKVLTQFRHPNLLTLMGFSRGVHHHEHQCLVYEYMENGSLEDAIDLKTRKKILDCLIRLDIIRDAARGLVFLHCAHDSPLVHRDVKSANVLLDTHYNAKVGDFGLARDLDHDGSGGKTSKVMGTSGYIAPEYLHGQISPKIDVYAFGVVILEVLTSLPSYDNTRKNAASLVMFMREEVEGVRYAYKKKEDINWPEGVAKDLSMLASLCLQDKPERRPKMEHILQCIEEVKLVAGGHRPTNSLLAQLTNAARQRLPPRQQNRRMELDERDEDAATTESEPVNDHNFHGKLVIPGRFKAGNKGGNAPNPPQGQPQQVQQQEQSEQGHQTRSPAPQQPQQASRDDSDLMSMQAQSEAMASNHMHPVQAIAGIPMSAYTYHYNSHNNFEHAASLAPGALQSVVPHRHDRDGSQSSSGSSQNEARHAALPQAAAMNHIGVGAVNSRSPLAQRRAHHASPPNEENIAASTMDPNQPVTGEDNAASQPNFRPDLSTGQLYGGGGNDDSVCDQSLRSDDLPMPLQVSNPVDEHAGLLLTGTRGRSYAQSQGTSVMERFMDQGRPSNFPPHYSAYGQGDTPNEVRAASNEYSESSVSPPSVGTLASQAGLAQQAANSMAYNEGQNAHAHGQEARQTVSIPESETGAAEYAPLRQPGREVFV